jgi:cytochrome b561/polyisoprenoid-binding protein YceI
MPNDLRYSRIAILLHWLIAAAILFEVGLGWRMDGPRGAQTFAVYQLHKSVGITILMLTLLRIGWRLTHRAPALSVHLKAWERGLAHFTHFGFYGLMLGLPLTGWLMVSTSKTAVPTILYGLIPWPHFPGTVGASAALRGTLNNIGDAGHHLLILGTFGLFALHVAGALKHHFFDRGDDFARMMPARRPALTVLLAVVGLCAAGALAVGNTITLGNSASVPAATAPLVQTNTAAPMAETATPEAEQLANEAAPIETALENEAAAVVVPVASLSKWTVEKANSRLSFQTDWSGSAVTGTFGSWNADIMFDPDALKGSAVSVSIDMTSANTGNSDTQSALPEEDWFAAVAHPKAIFTAKSFRKLGGNRYAADGTLNMRGVSKPLTLNFTLDIKGSTAKMNGSATLDRTAFGVGQGQWAATDAISGSVSVSVKLTATRK